MKIKAILFDLDETVLDRTRSLEQFLSWQADEQLNLPYSSCEKFIERFIDLDDNGQRPKEAVYTTLIDEFGIQELSAQNLDETYHTRFGHFTCEKRHIKESITDLRAQGIKTAIVSNGSSPFQENNVEAMGMSDLFDAVVVSEAAGFRKPDVKIFELTCSKIGVAPVECIFVGDNPETDIAGANNAGMYSVFVPTRKFPGCSHANKVCRDMRELSSLVVTAAEHRAGN